MARKSKVNVLPCWVIARKKKIVDVRIDKINDDESVLAWAYAANSRRTYGSGIALPRDYNRAKRCGYRIVRAEIRVKL